MNFRLNQYLHFFLGAILCAQPRVIHWRGDFGRLKFVGELSTKLNIRPYKPMTFGAFLGLKNR